MKTISIIIPCFNEERFISRTLEKVLEAGTGDLEKEVVIVDDGSTDRTTDIIEDFIGSPRGGSCILLKHVRNQGKGACIQTALNRVSGDIVIIQDADLEYSPDEYGKLLAPILAGHADVVYGSRFRGSEAHRVLFFFHSAGNKWLTFFSNLFTGLNLTDMETGYKVFRTEIISSIRLRENRFGFEPEVTAKISRIRKIRIYEVGISYFGRTYSDGKKIRLKDGIWALLCIIRYNLINRR